MAVGYTPMAVVVMTCSTLALYNAIELLLVIFMTFKQFKGLYFWSLLIASVGVIAYNAGFILVFFDVTHMWVGFIIDSYGWITMITGQAFVLYSRLHLVLRNHRVLKLVLWMIIIDAVIFHIPTTVMLFGATYARNPRGYIEVWAVYEKLQMTGFCIQEFIISGIYVRETVHLLQIVSKTSTRVTVWQLFTINVIIIAMDIALLAIEYKNLFVLEQSAKSVIYSIKLKLEFAILGKLVDIVKSGGRVLPAAKEDTSEYVNPARTNSDVTHAASIGKRKTSQPYWVEELEDTSAEHVETILPAFNLDLDLDLEKEGIRTVSADKSTLPDEVIMEKGGSSEESSHAARSTLEEYADFMREISRS